MGSSVLHAATDSEKMEVSVATSAANSNTYSGKTTSDNTVNNTACPLNPYILSCKSLFLSLSTLAETPI